jgi:hypothetical protein
MWPLDSLAEEFYSYRGLPIKEHCLRNKMSSHYLYEMDLFYYLLHLLCPCPRCY